jgi:GNAT superfamily N-acetyltransferase
VSAIVRPATLADADAIAQVHVATWQAAYDGLLPAGYLASLAAERRAPIWRTALSSGSATVHVAVDDDALIGFAAVGPSRDDGAAAGTGELTAIYVDPDHWGEGTGAALHDAGLASLAAAGHTKATLWVLDTNRRARGFYGRHGWSPDGGTKQAEIGDATITEVRYARQLLR